jgi:hypothetical protein
MGAAMPPAAAQQPPAINHASDSAAPPTRRRGRGGSGKRFVYNTVLGGALGIVVGYLILCNLRPDADILGLFPDRPPARPETSSPSPQRSARRTEPMRDPIDIPAAPKAPTVRPRSKETIERPTATVKTPDPFVGLPEFVELSEPANLAAVTIAQLPAAFAGPLDMRLESAAKTPEGQNFDVRRNGDAGQFDIVLGMGNGPVVAHVAREGPAIRFRWRATDVSPLSLRQLRNSVLRLESGEASKAIRLRGPVMQPAMRVSLKASRMTQPIAIESPPIPSSLRVQIGDLTQFPVTATIKDDQRPAGIGKPMIMALDKLNDADFPELEIVLLADGDQLRAEIRPRLVTPGKTYDLTTRVVEEQKKWLASRRPVVARELDTVTAEGKAVEARIAKIKSRVPRDQADRRLQAQELHKLRDRLETLNTRYKAIMEQKVQLDRAQRGIPPVEELVGKLHDKATIPFRIFALIGETELDLVRSEGFSR